MSLPTSEQFGAALAWAALVLLGYLLYLVVQPFLVPLGWACVLAVLLYPIFGRVSRRLGPGPAAGVVTVAAAIVLIGPAIALTSAFAREMVDIAQRLQNSLSNGQTASAEVVWQRVTERLPAAARIDLGTAVAALLQRVGALLVTQSAAILTNIAVFFVDLILALFATFFLLRDGDVIMAAVRRLLPMSVSARELFIARTADLIAAGVTSAVIVAGLQGLLGGIAFAIVGISAPVFWGVVMGFVCLLPFGAAVIWLPAAILLALGGSVGRALVLLGLGAGVVSGVDNVVRPLLLSGRVQMNGLVIFVSLLGGLSVFGLLGIVLGPIVVVTAMSLVGSYIDSVERI